jgi:hypothetical protein
LLLTQWRGASASDFTLPTQSSSPLTRTKL